ncbi:MAG: HPr family phosphocarrier protein [Bifidobacterium sp.]|uniref:HPr family phosphocarrier protein n=1 Tax=Bifidobacterium sp. TaxID=41200 RepID=UPI0039EAF0EF
MNKQFDFVITDPNGIHARPAGLLVQKAQECKSKVTILFKDKRVDAKRIFSVLGMGASQGDTLTFEVEGEDAEQAASQLQAFLKESL